MKAPHFQVPNSAQVSVVTEQYCSGLKQPFIMTIFKQGTARDSSFLLQNAWGLSCKTGIVGGLEQPGVGWASVSLSPSVSLSLPTRLSTEFLLAATLGFLIRWQPLGSQTLTGKLGAPVNVLRGRKWKLPVSYSQAWKPAQRHSSDIPLVKAVRLKGRRRRSPFSMRAVSKKVSLSFIYYYSPILLWL